MEGAPTQYRIPKWSRCRTRVLVIHAENFPRVEMSAQVFPQGLWETKHCEQVKGVAVRPRAEIP